jgi:hypothetical protein
MAESPRQQGEIALGPHMKSSTNSAHSTDCRLKPADLSQLERVKQLLRLLNDPYVGPYRLKETVTQIPVFSARCLREAAQARPQAEIEDIEYALSVIGNRGVEKVLLELLEDMTILKAEIDAQKRK